MSNNQINQGANTPFLDQVTVFWLDVSIWTGKAKLDWDDLQNGGYYGSLPPAKLASLGTKNLLDPKKISVFNKLKQQAQRLLLAHGIKFMEGFALPCDVAPKIIPQLEEIMKEFIQAKNDFLQHLDDSVEDWIEQMPSEYAVGIRSAKLDATKVAEKLKFNYVTYQVKPAGVGVDRLESAEKGMADELISDVTKVAEELYHKHVAGKEVYGISINTKQTLIGLRNKIHGLSFLNSNFMGLVSLLDGAIAEYQNSVDRKIHEPFSLRISNAVLILSSEDRIEDYSKGNITPQAGPQAMPQASKGVSQQATVVVPQSLPSPAVDNSNDADEDGIEGFFNTAPKNAAVVQTDLLIVPNEVTDQLKVDTPQAQIDQQQVQVQLIEDPTTDQQEVAPAKPVEPQQIQSAWF